MTFVREKGVGGRIIKSGAVIATESERGNKRGAKERKIGGLVRYEHPGRTRQGIEGGAERKSDRQAGARAGMQETKDRTRQIKRREGRQEVGEVGPAGLLYGVVSGHGYQSLRPR